MLDTKQYFLILGFCLAQGALTIEAQIRTQPYQYNGGTFTVVTVFDFYTTIETDAFNGTTLYPPILTVTNTDSGRSLTVSYISGNDYITGRDGNILIGNDVTPDQASLRTNRGVVRIDASSLGSGPLVFSVKETSELSSLSNANIRNRFGAPFIVWDIHPQSIIPSLSPYVPRPSPTPVSNPTPNPLPVSAKIHAVIISGRSDPAKIVTSHNVTLTGGVIALGKDPAPAAAPSSWTTGLRIAPDEALLTGTKIPPMTPNIIDVRIVKHEVVGDLTAPGPSP